MNSSARVRDQLVLAVSKVDGVQPHRLLPDVISAGDVWPVRVRASWRNACVTDQVWMVFAALPAGSRVDTVDAGDQLVDDIAAALFTFCQVAQVEDWAWPVSDGTTALPALRFTVNITE